MLRSLHIRDFVIVDHAELHFDAGFTVFSGETGAGKSILIDALSLVLGARGDAGWVREGARRADITAIFDVPPEAAGWLEEHALESPELLIRRTMDTQGRSKAFINGTPATLGQLRTLGGHLLDIHGQHAHQSLMHAARQRDLLDSHGEHHDLVSGVQQAWTRWRETRAALETARREATDQADRLERLALDVSFLDDLSPQPDEWPELCARQSRLAHAQALLAGANEAMEALDGEAGSAAQALTAAQHALQSLTRHDPSLEDICETLESARALCADAVSSLNGYADRVELDPEALSDAEHRMGRLFEAGRRFKTEPEELPGLHAELQRQLQQAAAQQDIAALDEACENARLTYERQADRLSEARRATATRLGEQVTAAMQTLSMDGGLFEAALLPAEPAAHGVETVEFRVGGHAGVSPRPLARVASGGELARISLALSVIASQAANVPTLIFDEVDAGIGGSVAEVVGRLLRELGERHQVLCVTHLPQVAACASQHIQVSKATEAGRTLSTITLLDPEGRVDEIARMLGGLRITKTTRQHAKEMLHLAESRSPDGRNADQQ